MSWRAHPLRGVAMPAVLPLSLPAGVLTDDTGMGVWRARTVPVLGEFGMYWAIWEPVDRRAKRYGGSYSRQIHGHPPALLDWSSAL